MKNIDLVNIILITGNVVALCSILFSIFDIVLYGIYTKTMIDIVVSLIILVGTALYLYNREKPEPLLEEDDIYL